MKQGNNVMCPIRFNLIKAFTKFKVRCVYTSRRLKCSVWTMLFVPQSALCPQLHARLCPFTSTPFAPHKALLRLNVLSARYTKKYYLVALSAAFVQVDLCNKLVFDHSKKKRLRQVGESTVT